MDSLLIRRRDLAFLLYDFLQVDGLARLPRFAQHSRATFDAALDTAYSIAEEHFATHAHALDEREPSFDGERVDVIPQVKAALDAFRAAGFIAATQDYDAGGMQLPAAVEQACMAVFSAANISTVAYAFLTRGAANLIGAHGSDEQRARYLPAMREGRFFGTMALTEPQAGSSLADIRTTAEPLAGGGYRIRGNKIFISGGDHQLAENIVHLVLAKIKGAPAGVKGISLFIVPKLNLERDGRLGERNDVALAGLIHKMGYRGTTSTMLNFGERGECIGELVGEPHQGLAYMFQMMNEARVQVGLGAAALACTGYLHSLDYATKRPQGRSPHGKDPASPQIPIVEHADVRRMLLAQKAYAEGALALCLYAAKLLDLHHHSEDAAERARCLLLLDILTPIVKSWPSQYGLEANAFAIQVLGGYGYTREYPVERLYRDNRLNAIHEGTHGIQAIDLLGRKVPMQDGAAFAALLEEIRRTMGACRTIESLRTHADTLEDALHLVEETTRVLLGTMRADLALALSNASVYLEMLGHVVVAWVWLEQARVAIGAGENGACEPTGFYGGKLVTCGWFFRSELPKVRMQAKLLQDLDRTYVDLRVENL
ncbi:MAG: acyl-CoA dehydrogenase [Burkholderiaceae bacterium]